ncbi:unnamed protein product, partial [Mesorhabditis belari]|uniref:VWFA domain-containing protein n=1 Tax=Mesorhabditis belari TaxID=2138241 RepID=A0AAF3FDV7_9BILA
MSISDEHKQEKTSVKRREASDLDKDWQMIDGGTESRQKKAEKGNSGNKVIDQIDIAAASFKGNCGSVDLCFLIDATGSMQPHIDGVKAQIKKIVHNLTSEAATKQHVQRLRLALVAYRDHGDARVKPNSQGSKKTFGKVFFTSKSSPEAIEGDQFEIFPFSTSEHEFEAFCTKVRAQGGDDQPEDVFGGLEKARVGGAGGPPGGLCAAVSSGDANEQG